VSPLIAHFEVLTPALSLSSLWLVFVAMGAGIAAWFRFSARAHWLQLPIVAVFVGAAVWDFSDPLRSEGRGLTAAAAPDVGELARIRWRS
jgi:hypothetical protein